MSIGENIKKIRVDAGLTQKELGERLGITSQSIAQWETGRREPKYQSMVKIADALNVPVSSLYGISEDNQYKQDAIKQALDLSVQDDGRIDTKAFSENLDYEYGVMSDADIAYVNGEIEKLCLKTFDIWSEDELRTLMNGYFSGLNRFGQIEAIRRVQELICMKKYRLEDNQGK
mgnify:FL=1